MVDVGFKYSAQDGFTPNAGAHSAIVMHWFAAVFSYMRLALYFQSPNLNPALDLSQEKAEQNNSTL
jgi:hypothetical protein